MDPLKESAGHAILPGQSPPLPTATSMFDPWNVIPFAFAPRNVAHPDVQVDVIASKYRPGCSVVAFAQFNVFHPADGATVVAAVVPMCARNVPVLS